MISLWGGERGKLCLAAGWRLAMMCNEVKDISSSLYQKAETYMYTHTDCFEMLEPSVISQHGSIKGGVCAFMPI